MSQWDDSQDPYDTPYNGDGGGPAAQPQTTPSGDPWTPDELAQSQQWANNYYSTHQIPSNYGTPDDIANSYVEKRRAGMDHAGAMAYLQTVPGLLGWDKYQAPAPKATETGTTDPAAAPAPAPGPVAPPAVGGGPPPSPGTVAAPPTTGGGPYTPPPAYVPPPAFEYDAFKAPTSDDVLNDAGYQFSLQQGTQAMQQSAAARGVLNTGGTLKDLIGFGQNLASTRYDDVYGRDLSTYNTNRGNAFDAYKTNYGIGKDAYDTNVVNEYNNPFSYGMQSAGLQQNNNQFNASLGQANNQFNSSLDFNKWLQNYKMNVTDPFDERYKTLSLL